MRFRQVHLDFHTGEKIPGVGSKFDPEQFAEGLRTACVDSVTLFSKCHHGWSYHPTKVNRMHPGLDFDLLGEQLKVCAALGVRAPVYISAGLDEKEAVCHPEWLARSRDETPFWTPNFYSPGFHRLCFNTSYMDLLLAQIREVVERYHPVEIFLDICAPVPCCCAACRADMKRKGYDADDPEDVRRQSEEVYLEYAARVRKTLDEYDPDIEVFHNMGHLSCGRRDISDTQSHLELESLPTGGWGYDDFPFSALYAETLGKEYLGMTGKFHSSWGEFGGFKHPNALRYEVSLSAALGARCSIGDQLHPDGSADMTSCRLIGAAYGELREKEKWCEDTRCVADIGLLSAEALGAAAGRTVPRTADIGANRILLEGKYLYSVIDARADLSKYRLLVIPDWGRLTPELAARIGSYLEAGGKVLASGESCLETDRDVFAVDLGVRYLRANCFSPTYMDSEGRLKTNNGILLMYAKNHLFELDGAERFCGLQNPYFNRTAEHFCSHRHAPNRKSDAGPGAAFTSGSAYIGWEIFSDYAENGALQNKETVIALIDLLLGDEKTLRTDLPDRAVVTLRRKNDGSAYINHLLFAHTTVRGTNTEIIEDLIPLYGTHVEIRLAERPESVTLQPQNEPLKFEYSGGKLSYTVGSFTCHQMVVIS